MQIFMLKPTEYSHTLAELVTFLAQVSHCYAKELADFPQQLREVLQRHSTVLDPGLRMNLVKALMLLRNKGLIPATTILEQFFGLFRCKDKLLRKTLYSYIIQDIKNTNAKHKNAKLNTQLQNFMYTMLQDNDATAAKTSLDVMVELYRREVWHDAKTVNVITTACFSKVTKILVAAIKFFLGSDVMEEDDSDDEDDEPQKTSKEIMLGHRVGKKSNKRKKKMERALQMLKKTKKKKKKAPSFNFSAIHLIHDPQSFAERLLKQLEATNERFEVKIMMINLISRLVGIHELFLFNFYPFLQRFLQPHQREVTRILTYSAQASHELVPPEIINGVVMSIANNFITERNSGEVMAVGINAVREICNRCPLAMSEELLQDLAQYKSHREKSVHMAARSLIQLFREKNPTLLHKKDQGKPTEASKEFQAKDYGEVNAKDYIPGAEVLKTNEEKDQEPEDDGWESCSEDSDDSDDGSWIDVSHSEDELDENAVDPCEGMAPEEKISKAREIVESRILSQDEFQKVSAAQLSKQMQDSKFRHGKGSKRKSDVIDIDAKPKSSGEIVSLDDIERVHKKRKHDKESRLETVMAGRDDTVKFGARYKREDIGQTNREKRKNKPFEMVKHKVRKTKNHRSYQDKQMALKRSLLKKQKHGK
ncbi:unnamed protein product [Owenia fusiformis]|uniref:Protein SDA1 n=1 Tax=Owenia fusiformis TaxID=6347 RepID=A0A8S4N927_OWEFU|nr:unnamed protein product [Owenia fusiformis]